MTAIRTALIAPMLLLAACAGDPLPDEAPDAYVGRQVDTVNYKWAALDAVVQQAQADGVNLWDADSEELVYIKLLCNLALVGPVLAPSPPQTVISAIDWALVPVHVANACKIAMRIATPATVPEVIEIAPEPAAPVLEAAG